jgi:hypothetical protein
MMNMRSSLKPMAGLKKGVRIPVSSAHKDNSKHTPGEAKNADLIFLAPFLLISAKKF